MLVASRYHHKIKLMTPGSIRRLHLRQSDLFRQLSYIMDIASRLIQLQLLFEPFCCVSRALALKHRSLAYTLIRGALRYAGPAFTKLGQWAASRPECLPMDLCDVLAELHSLGLSHSMDWNQKVILDQLGVDISTLFMSFDPVPSGADLWHRYTGQSCGVEWLWPSKSHTLR